MKRGSGIPVFLADAVAGLTIFVLGVGSIAGFDGWPIDRAVAADLPGSAAALSPLLLAHDADGAGLAALLRLRDVTSDAARMAVLGLSFATMFGCNLAFARHLRRVYASHGGMGGGGVVDPT